MSNIRCDEFNDCERHIGEFFVSDISLLDWSAKDWNVAREVMFHVSNSSKNNYTSIPYNGGDFIYSCYMSNRSTTEQLPIGIVYGYYDNDNYNKFLINGNQFRYFSVEKGVNTRIVPWTQTDYVNDEWNQLMIQKNGDKHSFYLNGYLLDEIDAFGFRVNNFGFSVTSIIAYI